MTRIFLPIVLLFAFAACNKDEGTTTTNTTTTPTTNTPAGYTGTGSVTQGVGATTIASLYSCTGGRPTAVGTITATDNTTWTLPAANQFQTATKASDLYNPCTGVTHANATAVDLNAVPLVTIDADGDEVIGYIFADNYFELYVNGTLIGVDAVPFTPFNSSVVRFKAKKPYTIAMKLIDWEESLGIGTEANGGSAFHPGDGGLVASFYDASGNSVAVTNSSWKAQTFYTAPVKDLSCLTESGQARSSTSCNTDDAADGSSFYGVHWAVPTDWMSKTFDDSNWPAATTYTNATVGVNNKPAYTNFIAEFDDSRADAQFIWSTNLILDNEVLVRYTVN